MANTSKGIHYPDKYSVMADVPEDMKKMAESIDKLFKDNDTKNEQQNANIQNNTQNIQTLQNQNTNLQQENAYLQEENTLLKSQIPNGQAEGENITLTDSSNLPYKKFNIGGNSIQDGTPTPEAPVLIKSVGDDGTVGVKQSGKNLLKGLSTPVDDSSYWSDVNKNYFTPLEDGWGRFSYDNASGTSTVFVNAKVRLSTVGLKPNTQYTLMTEIRNSSMSENSDVFFQVVTSNELASFKSAIALEYGKINTGGIYKNLTTTKEDLSSVLHSVDTYLRLGAGTKGTVEARISLIEGDIDIDTFNYEQYVGNDYILQTSEPLRSLPNGVRDTREDDGIHRRVGSIVLDGSDDEGWALTTYDNLFMIIIKNYKSQYAYCSNFKVIINNKINYNESAAITLNNGEIAFRAGTTKDRLYLKSIDFSTVDEVKEYLSANPTTLFYELAEEIIEPYTDKQLQNATSYKNITHIFSTDEVSPLFDITYKKDLETLFNNLNSALVQGGV